MSITPEGLLAGEGPFFFFFFFVHHHFFSPTSLEGMGNRRV